MPRASCMNHKRKMHLNVCLKFGWEHSCDPVLTMVTRCRLYRRQMNYIIARMMSTTFCSSGPIWQGCFNFPIFVCHFKIFHTRNVSLQCFIIKCLVEANALHFRPLAGMKRQIQTHIRIAFT